MLALGAGARVCAQNPANPQEPPDLAAYRGIYDPTVAADKKAERAEAFLSEKSDAFQSSRYRDSVYVILYQSYRATNQWTKVLSTIDRLEQLAPRTPVEKKALFYLEAMKTAEEELKDISRAVEYAKKVIAIHPNNVVALQMLETARAAGEPRPTNAGPDH
jgi:lipopolysaccharide biosynthesis regulator YciM